MSTLYGESIKEVEAETKTRMHKALEDLHREMATIRTGRASPTILEGIRVSYYGTPTPLNQVANLSVPEPALIMIQPWDISQIGAIEKAILGSDLGLNPTNDGKVIRLSIPALTEERRRELVKHLHNMVEQHRVAVRNIRREANEQLKHLEKDKKISEDDHHRGHDSVQKLTDGMISQLDEAGKAKEAEILEIG